jgi:hypothetical protein
MATSGVGSAVSSESLPAATTAADVHPSSPIPVQGPPLGEGVRVALGESGAEIFPLILGGAEFGWNVDLESSHDIMDAYVERGGNALHTADSFSGGRSEHIIGQWLHSRGLRDEMTLAVRIGGHPDNPGLGPVNLVRAVEASLTRLRTDRIDVLYLDAATGPIELEETLATAEWLVESGKARALGAAGFTAAQLVEARIYVSAGYPRISVLAWRTVGARCADRREHQSSRQPHAARPGRGRHRARRAGCGRRRRVAARAETRHCYDRQRVRAAARRRACSGNRRAAQPQPARRHRAGVRVGPHRCRPGPAGPP